MTGAALDRVRDPATSALALPPGLAFGSPAFDAFLPAARGVRAALQRAVHPRGMAAGIGIVPGRIGAWLVSPLGFLVGLPSPPSIGAADPLGVPGIDGAAIGFASRDIPQTLPAGISTPLTRRFRIGDRIVAGGHEGTVEDIQVRATAIRGYDNRRAVIPNPAPFGDEVPVNTAYDRRRSRVRAGIGHGDDIARAKRVISGAMHGAEGVLADPPPRVTAR